MNEWNARLMAIFQGNLGKPVPLCLRFGFYFIKIGRRRRWWRLEL